MDYTVRSFKDAIDITLYKLDYEPNNVDIIRKLIEKALIGDYNYFTNTDGARKYVKEKTSDGIKQEMLRIINSTITNIDELIVKYIDKLFVNKVDINVILEEIKNRSNLEEVSKKIRNISTNSEDDLDFYNNLWKYYTNMFVDTTNIDTYYKIRYDMIEAALNFALINRENATVLKSLDPNSQDMTIIDAVKMVEEYVYNNEIDKLLEYINNNSMLSGLLLQNLFDYTYYKKEEVEPKKSLNDLDNELSKYEMEQSKEEILKQIIFENNIPNGFSLTKGEVIANLLKNTLYLNIYTSNKKSIDHTERHLYTGDKTLDEDTIHARMMSNNKISNKLVINGINSNADDIVNVVNNLSNNEFIFLINMYLVSRSIKENKKKLNEASYFGTNEQLHILNLLEDNNLIERLENRYVK